MCEMAGFGAPLSRCHGLCCMVFGPGDNTTRFRRWAEDFEREMKKFEEFQPAGTSPDGYMRPSPFVPVTERMPDPCPCCGAVHRPKSLAERIHATP